VRCKQSAVAAILQEFRERVPVKMGDAAALESEGGLEDFQLQREELVLFSAHAEIMSRYLPFVKRAGLRGPVSGRGSSSFERHPIDARARAKRSLTT
jgi:hypothetical protein